MAGPVIEVDIEKIEKNARAVVKLCADHGIDVTGVTKVTCGMPQVAQAMIRGGVTQIGESRLENIHRLRAGGVNKPMMLLRIPPSPRRRRSCARWTSVSTPNFRLSGVSAR